MTRHNHHEGLLRSKHDGMNLDEARDLVDSVITDPDASGVYGQPYETTDGATVVPVAKLRGRIKPGAEDTRSWLRAKPVGVFVIRGDSVRFEPAVDATRIALMGIFVGLVSATLAGIAMVRRPPWPDLHGDISRR
jgi:hypothetical protein